MNMALFEVSKGTCRCFDEWGKDGKQGGMLHPVLDELLADAQFLDQITILVDIVLLHVFEHAAALADEHEQTAAGMVILRIHLQVFGQFTDPFGQ